ncbi:DUF6580 family putative transport protein [Oerskovia sp. M15]
MTRRAGARGCRRGLGIGGSLWFFVWTNFGTWFQGRGVWYPAGLDGLVASYVAGLPFLRTMLIGNLVLLPSWPRARCSWSGSSARTDSWLRSRTRPEVARSPAR